MLEEDSKAIKLKLGKSYSLENELGPLVSKFKIYFYFIMIYLFYYIILIYLFFNYIYINIIVNPDGTLRR